MKHTSEHEDLLQRIFEGELAESDARARELLLACAECRRDLARLRALDERIADGIVRERADLTQARAEASAEDAALLRDTLELALPPRPGRPWRRPAVLALAAGVLALAALGVRWLRPADEPVPEFLLGGRIRCLEPVGEVGSYAQFRWESETPPRTHFELRFHTVVEGQRGAEVRRISVPEPRWMPTSEEEHALPSPLIWEVVLVDETSGDELEHGWALARR